MPRLKWNSSHANRHTSTCKDVITCHYHMMMTLTWHDSDTYIMWCPSIMRWWCHWHDDSDTCIMWCLSIMRWWHWHDSDTCIMWCPFIGWWWWWHWHDMMVTLVSCDVHPSGDDDDTDMIWHDTCINAERMKLSENEPRAFKPHYNCHKTNMSKSQLTPRYILWSRLVITLVTEGQWSRTHAALQWISFSTCHLEMQANVM